MDAQRTVSGWIARPVVDPERVAIVRDRLYGWLGAPEPYRREDEPHLSLFGVRLPETRAADFERDLRVFGETVGPCRVLTDGYRLYPSTRNPMVVAFDLDLSFDALASPVADLLAVHGGRIGRGPVAPHVTLFKGGVRGEELQWARLAERTRSRLAAAAGTNDDHDPPPRLLDPRIELALGPPEIEWNGTLADG